MDKKINICMVGAAGRMGCEIIKAASKDGNCIITGAVEYPASPRLGIDAHINAGLASQGCFITADIEAAAANADVIIDFAGAGTAANIAQYRKIGKPVVVGSTGLNKEDTDRLESLAKDLPLLAATNMSLGINLLAKFVKTAAKILGEDFDIEVFEAHHKHKVDAPSGTALTLGKAAAEGMGVNFDESAVFCRHGITGERAKKTIGFQVLRGGDISGDHTVYFCGDKERIELTHRTGGREPLANGAIKAAKWLIGKEKGLYSIDDVLGL